MTEPCTDCSHDEVRLPLEDWRTATLLDPWTQQPAVSGVVPVPAPSFFLDPLGICHIRGGIVGTPGSPNPFATPAFMLDDDCIPANTVFLDAPNGDLGTGVGVAIIIVLGRDVAGGVFDALQGAVVPSFADYDVTFLDGQFRVAA